MEWFDVNHLTNPMISVEKVGIADNVRARRFL
jgi:hypothetical protein